MQEGTKRLETALSKEGVGVVLLEILTNNIDFSRPSNFMQSLQEDLITAIYQKSDSDVTSPSSIPTHRRTDLVNTFLEKLRYPDMEDRKGRIAKAHKETFQWIFQNDPSQQNRWSNFREWLESDSQLYWITGKAGSGKSTLIKYVCQEQDCPPQSFTSSRAVGESQCAKYLRKWAGGFKIITAVFFFWNSGVRYQMAQRGLLISLLHQILQKVPEYIPEVSPHRWEAMCLFNDDQREREWTEKELHEMLRAAVHEVSKSMKMCLFVDGLDEFSGEHHDLISLFRDLMEHPNVKVCVSSRPWLVFEEAFMHKPSMMLQDLTYADIKNYVTSKMQGNQGFKQLLRREPQFANQLIENVVSKASGVFLWVNLVVESLLAGMSYGDRTSDLQRRLDLLPPDLENLYEKILKSLDPFYLEHAAQLFRYVEESRDPPSLLLLSFADEETTESAIDRPIEPVSQEDQSLRADTMRRRLNSRCKGFLEVGRSSYNNRGNNEETVQYLHRTVKDYLTSEEAQTTLRTALKPSFDVHLNLLVGSLAYLKTVDNDRQILKRKNGNFWARARICLDTAAQVRSSSRAKKILLLDELDRTGNTIARRVSTRGIPGDDPQPGDIEIISLLKDKDWVASHPDITKSTVFGANFMSLAVRYGFVDYVDAKTNQGCIVKRSLSEEWPLLLDAIYADEKHAFGRVDSIAKPEMIACILKHGANPNYPLANISRSSLTLAPTIWHQTAIHIGEHYRSFCLTESWETIAESMINHGAKVDKQLFNVLVERKYQWSQSYDQALGTKMAKSLYGKFQTIERSSSRGGWSSWSLWNWGQI